MKRASQLRLHNHGIKLKKEEGIPARVAPQQDFECREN